MTMTMMMDDDDQDSGIDNNNAACGTVQRNYSIGPTQH